MDIFVYSLSIPFFPSILLELAGQDRGGIYFGISQSVGNSLAMFSGVLSGYLSDKFSRKAAVFLSQLFSGGCCLLIAIGMHYEHSPFKSILFCLAGYTLRKINRTYAIMVAYTMDTTAEKEKDRHISRLNGAVGFAFACGPAVAGFFSTAMQKEWVFLYGSFVCFFSAILAKSYLVSAPTSTPDRSFSWKAIKSVVFHKKMLKTFTVYFLGCLGQFCYISTIGLVTPSKFGISGVWYGYMVSYFGISYALSQLFLVPYICKNYGTEKTRLMGSLAVTGAGRLYLGFTKSVYILFILHFFVAVGSALLMHTTTIIVNRFGHQFHLGGTVNGAMDSVRRLSGVIAPMIAVPVHYVYYKKDGTGMSPGAVLASLFYFVGFGIAYKLFDKVSVKATKNSDGTIQSKKVQ